MRAVERADTAPGSSRAVKPFRILLVCTGNVCRSPIAEHVLQDWLDGIRPDCFEVRSAGTRALAGSRMTQPAARKLAGLAPPRMFVARQLTAGLLPDQDLILGMTRRHRSEIVRLYPGVLRRTFTLREFGRMVQCLSSGSTCSQDFADPPAARWRRLVALAPAVRPETLAGDERDDDVVDPYGRRAEVYDQMLEEMMPALKALFAFEQAFSKWGET